MPLVRNDPQAPLWQLQPMPQLQDMSVLQLRPVTPMYAALLHNPPKLQCMSYINRGNLNGTVIDTDKQLCNKHRHTRKPMNSTSQKLCDVFRIQNGKQNEIKKGHRNQNGNEKFGIKNKAENRTSVSSLGFDNNDKYRTIQKKILIDQNGNVITEILADSDVIPTQKWTFGNMGSESDILSSGHVDEHAPVSTSRNSGEWYTSSLDINANRRVTSDTGDIQEGNLASAVDNQRSNGNNTVTRQTCGILNVSPMSRDHCPAEEREADQSQVYGSGCSHKMDRNRRDEESPFIQTSPREPIETSSHDCNPRNSGNASEHDTEKMLDYNTGEVATPHITQEDSRQGNIMKAEEMSSEDRTVDGDHVLLGSVQEEGFCHCKDLTDVFIKSRGVHPLGSLYCKGSTPCKCERKDLSKLLSPDTNPQRKRHRNNKSFLCEVCGLLIADPPVGICDPPAGFDEVELPDPEEGYPRKPIINKHHTSDEIPITSRPLQDNDSTFSKSFRLNAKQTVPETHILDTHFESVKLQTGSRQFTTSTLDDGKSTPTKRQRIYQYSSSDFPEGISKSKKPLTPDGKNYFFSVNSPEVMSTLYKLPAAETPYKYLRPDEKGTAYVLRLSDEKSSSYRLLLPDKDGTSFKLLPPARTVTSSCKLLKPDEKCVTFVLKLCDGKPAYSQLLTPDDKGTSYVVNLSDGKSSMYKLLKPDEKDPFFVMLSLDERCTSYKLPLVLVSSKSQQTVEEEDKYTFPETQRLNKGKPASPKLQLYDGKIFSHNQKSVSRLHTDSKGQSINDVKSVSQEAQRPVPFSAAELKLNTEGEQSEHNLKTEFFRMHQLYQTALPEENFEVTRSFQGSDTSGKGNKNKGAETPAIPGQSGLYRNCDQIPVKNQNGTSDKNLERPLAKLLSSLTDKNLARLNKRGARKSAKHRASYVSGSFCPKKSRGGSLSRTSSQTDGQRSMKSVLGFSNRTPNMLGLSKFMKLGEDALCDVSHSVLDRNIGNKIVEIVPKSDNNCNIQREKKCPQRRLSDNIKDSGTSMAVTSRQSTPSPNKMKESVPGSSIIKETSGFDLGSSRVTEPKSFHKVKGSVPGSGVIEETRGFDPGSRRVAEPRSNPTPIIDGDSSGCDTRQIINKEPIGPDAGSSMVDKPKGSDSRPCVTGEFRGSDPGSVTVMEPRGCSPAPSIFREPPGSGAGLNIVLETRRLDSQKIINGEIRFPDSGTSTVTEPKGSDSRTSIVRDSRRSDTGPSLNREIRQSGPASNVASESNRSDTRPDICEVIERSDPGPSIVGESNGPEADQEFNGGRYVEVTMPLSGPPQSPVDQVIEDSIKFQTLYPYIYSVLKDQAHTNTLQSCSKEDSLNERGHNTLQSCSKEHSLKERRHTNIPQFCRKKDSLKERRHDTLQSCSKEDSLKESGHNNTPQSCSKEDSLMERGHTNTLQSCSIEDSLKERGDNTPQSCSIEDSLKERGDNTPQSCSIDDSLKERGDNTPQSCSIDDSLKERGDNTPQSCSIEDSLKERGHNTLQSCSIEDSLKERGDNTPQSCSIDDSLKERGDNTPQSCSIDDSLRERGDNTPQSCSIDDSLKERGDNTLHVMNKMCTPMETSAEENQHASHCKSSVNVLPSEIERRRTYSYDFFSSILQQDKRVLKAHVQKLCKIVSYLDDVFVRKNRQDLLDVRDLHTCRGLQHYKRAPRFSYIGQRIVRPKLRIVRILKNKLRPKLICKLKERLETCRRKKSTRVNKKHTIQRKQLHKTVSTQNGKRQPVSSPTGKGQLAKATLKSAFGLVNMVQRRIKAQKKQNKSNENIASFVPSITAPIKVFETLRKGKTSNMAEMVSECPSTTMLAKLREKLLRRRDHQCAENKGVKQQLSMAESLEVKENEIEAERSKVEGQETFIGESEFSEDSIVDSHFVRVDGLERIQKGQLLITKEEKEDVDFREEIGTSDRHDEKCSIDKLPNSSLPVAGPMVSTMNDKDYLIMKSTEQMLGDLEEKSDNLSRKECVQCFTDRSGDVVENIQNIASTDGPCDEEYLKILNSSMQPNQSFDNLSTSVTSGEQDKMSPSGASYSNIGPEETYPLHDICPEKIDPSDICPEEMDPSDDIHSTSRSVKQENEISSYWDMMFDSLFTEFKNAFDIDCNEFKRNVDELKDVQGTSAHAGKSTLCTSTTTERIGTTAKRATLDCRPQEPSGDVNGILCEPSGDVNGIICEPSGDVDGILCEPSVDVNGILCEPSGDVNGIICEPSGDVDGILCEPSVDVNGILCEPSGDVNGIICEPSGDVNGIICEPSGDVNGIRHENTSCSDSIQQHVCNKSLTTYCGCGPHSGQIDAVFTPHTNQNVVNYSDKVRNQETGFSANTRKPDQSFMQQMLKLVDNAMCKNTDGSKTCSACDQDVTVSSTCGTVDGVLGVEQGVTTSAVDKVPVFLYSDISEDDMDLQEMEEDSISDPEDPEYMEDLPYRQHSAPLY